MTGDKFNFRLHVSASSDTEILNDRCALVATLDSDHTDFDWEHGKPLTAEVVKRWNAHSSLVSQRADLIMTLTAVAKCLGLEDWTALAEDPSVSLNHSAAAVATEKERCARLADAVADASHERWDNGARQAAAEDIAATIRSVTP